VIDEYPEQRATKLVAKYPQFRTAGALLVDAIVYALPQVDAVIYGTRADMAVELLACDWLMSSEYGQSLRSENDVGDSRFRKQFDEIKLQVAPRMIVI
jgi:hypothetical protein